jgi:hypothetical protein
MVWAEKMDPNVHQDTVRKLLLTAFYLCNKDMVVPVRNHTKKLKYKLALLA